jgi:hypothetical protein
MRNFSIITLTIVVLLSVSACSSKKSASNTNGFTAIFNGKNWDGWYKKIRNGSDALADSVYQIENGAIHVFKEVPKGSEIENGKNPTHGLFYTNKVYSQYILKFEYKWGKNKANNYSQFQYDAGVYYHVNKDNIWPTGLEYQVRYNDIKDKNHTGDVWGQKGYDWTANGKNEFAFEADGGKPQPVRGAEHLAKATRNFNGLNDKWNQCEIIVMGDKYAIHKLNGDIVNMITNLPFGEGKIGFQSETGEIYYKNIQIKEFKDFVPAESFLK